MALPVFPAAAAAFLDGLNNDPYDPVANPKGLDDGGHIVLWPEGNEAISVLANYFNALGLALQTMAAQVAADADAAEQGSGTEATVAAIRSGLAAYYLSIRNVYGANVPVALTDAASIAWDMATGINFDITIAAANRAMASPTNKVAGKSGILRIYQDATGGRAITTWGSDYVWISGEPIWPTASGAWITVSYACLANGKVELSYAGASA